MMASDFNPPAILFGPGGNTNATVLSDFGPMQQGATELHRSRQSHVNCDVTDMYADLAEQVEADWADPNLAM